MKISQFKLSLLTIIIVTLKTNVGASQVYTFDERLLARQLLELNVQKITPVSHTVKTSNFGPRKDPFTGIKTFHAGIDLSAPAGTAILAAGQGKVLTANTHPEYGLMIDIDHGNGCVTRYAHVKSPLVKKGDFVNSGQEIAAVSNSGRATGAHLHFEIRINGVPKNPKLFFNAININEQNTQQNQYTQS